MGDQVWKGLICIKILYQYFFYLEEAAHTLDEKTSPASVSTHYKQDNTFQIHHSAKICILSDQIIVPKRLDVIVPSEKHGELSEDIRRPLLFSVEGKT